LIPDDELDVTATETAQQIDHISTEDVVNTTESTGTGMLTKLLFFGVIFALVAVLLRARSTKNSMGEKSYA